MTVSQAAIEAIDLARPDVALAGAVLLAVAVSLAPAVAALVRRLFPGRNVFFARWGFSHVGLALLLFLATSMLVGGLLPRERLEQSLPWALGAVCLVFAVVSAFVVRVAQRLDPEGIACLGLRTERNGSAILAGLAAYVLLWPGLYGTMLLWPWLLSLLGESYQPQAFGSLFEGAEGAALVIGIVLAVGVQPFLEELLFRGFLQPLLVQNFRDAGGVALASVAFALPHGASAFLPIFAFSLVLGGIMLRTQRLAAVWAMHALHNGIQVAILLAAGPLPS